jgi:hypothetical protein
MGATKAKASLTLWGIDPRTDKVVIGLTHITAALRAAAAKQFGNTVELVTEGRAQRDIARFKLPRPPKIVHITSHRNNHSVPRSGNTITPDIYGNRQNDTADLGLLGGDQIVWYTSPSDWAECTAGFSWNTNDMITAGHCAPSCTTWYQGYLDKSNNTIYEYTKIGPVAQVNFTNKGLDTERVSAGGLYLPLVYTVTRPLNLGNDPVFGESAPSAGYGICADGAISGEVCGATVTYTDTCIPFAGGITTCHLAVANCPRVCSQPGDSGGPVYTYAGNQVEAVGASGTIVGSQNSGMTVLFQNINSLTQYYGTAETTQESQYALFGHGTNLVINASGYGGSGTKLVLWPYVATTNELWIPHGNGTLSPVYNTSLCVNVPGYNYSNGVQLILYGCGNYSNEKFHATLLDPSTGEVRIMPLAATGKCLNGSGGNTKGAAVIL